MVITIFFARMKQKCVREMRHSLKLAPRRPNCKPTRLSNRIEGCAESAQYILTPEMALPDVRRLVPGRRRRLKSASAWASQVDAKCPDRLMVVRLQARKSGCGKR